VHREEKLECRESELFVATIKILVFSNHYSARSVKQWGGTSKVLREDLSNHIRKKGGPEWPRMMGMDKIMR
jgi:hypothetical protein